MIDECPGLANEAVSLDSCGTISGVVWAVRYVAGEAGVKGKCDE